MPPKLNRVIRLDSLPMNQTYYTDEGYLIDRPILTSTGIFEYHNSDGSVRRELRLPEEVFDAQSLASFKGRPVIITHDAGMVTKDNVHKNQIGTILTGGYRSGDDVRAEIIIHDTDEMKRAGLKELSLGYNLDLDETEGEWNGQHYDAIQRNIRINHLALVREARAGEQARLNIDSRDNSNTLKGERIDMNAKKTKKMRSDGILSTEELKAAIEQYRKNRSAQADAEEPAVEEPAAKPIAKPVEEPVMDEEPEQVVVPVAEEIVAKDAEELVEPEVPVDEAARKDEDINTLIDIIDTLLAERDFDAADEVVEELVEEENEDGDDDVVPNATEEEVATDGCEPETIAEQNEDADEEAEEPILNTDSVDYQVNQRIRNGMLGRQLNLDGLERLSVTEGRKTIIKVVRPKMNLDGKSSAYVDAAFDLAAAELESTTRKTTEYQKSQMFNKDSAEAMRETDSAMSARERMIARLKREN